MRLPVADITKRPKHWSRFVTSSLTHSAESRLLAHRLRAALIGSFDALSLLATSLITALVKALLSVETSNTSTG
eukprot:16257-Heterococcus_DN1.PRE.4